MTMDNEQNSEEEELDEEEPEEGSETEEEESTGEGDEGDEEETPQTVTIDGVKYTPDQVKEMQTKAKGYDALLPEFTTKSQRLAEFEKGGKGVKGQETPEKAPYEDPNWQPKSLSEIGQAIVHAREAGKREVLAELESRETIAKEAKQQVDDFVADVKKSDKDFDEDDFFQYAVKHKFPINTVGDLRAVHSAYSDTQAALVAGEKKGRTGKDARSEDKVNVPKGGEEKSPNFDDIHAEGGSIFDRMEKGLKRVRGNK